MSINKQTLNQSIDIIGKLYVAEGTVLGNPLVGSEEAGMLRWNGAHFQGYTGSEWIQLDLVSTDVNISLDSLNNVTITSGTENDILYLNGSNEWVNRQDYWTLTGTTIELTDANNNLGIGNIELTPDGGVIETVNMDVTSTSIIGTENSYFFSVNDISQLKIYSISDGVGGVSETGIVIESTYQYIGDPTTNGSWRFFNDNGDLTFEKLIGGTWTYSGSFSE